MEVLPDDIIGEILKFLSHRDLLAFSYTCHQYRLLYSRFFRSIPPAVYSHNYRFQEANEWKLVHSFKTAADIYDTHYHNDSLIFSIYRGIENKLLKLSLRTFEAIESGFVGDVCTYRDNGAICSRDKEVYDISFDDFSRTNTVYPSLTTDENFVSCLGYDEIRYCNDLVQPERVLNLTTGEIKFRFFDTYQACTKLAPEIYLGIIGDSRRAQNKNCSIVVLDFRKAQPLALTFTPKVPKITAINAFSLDRIIFHDQESKLEVYDLRNGLTPSVTLTYDLPARSPCGNTITALHENRYLYIEGDGILCMDLDAPQEQNIIKRFRGLQDSSNIFSCYFNLKSGCVTSIELSEENQKKDRLNTIRIYQVKTE